VQLEEEEVAAAATAEAVVVVGAVLELVAAVVSVEYSSKYMCV
jgi:hypothetical protein